jgi:hypothetical protein
MDPLSLLIGGVLLGTGWLVGRFAPGRRQGPKPVTPICGCEHHLAHHDPKTGQCGAEDRRVIKRDRAQEPIAWEATPCTCKQYSGPIPIDSVYAPEITG